MRRRGRGGASASGSGAALQHDPAQDDQAVADRLLLVFSPAPALSRAPGAGPSPGSVIATGGRVSESPGLCLEMVGGQTDRRVVVFGFADPWFSV